MALPGLPCSYRGIPFRWEQRGGETTPRMAEHDVPQKAGRWHEDMAPGPAVYTFDAFLIAPNTLLVRAMLIALQAACRNQRPGTLMHPIYGLVSCVCKGFKWTESSDTLNRIDLDLNFEEDIGRQEPMTTRWIGSALASAVTAAEAAIGAALDEVWNLAELPAYAIADATAALLLTSTALVAGTALLSQPVQAAVAVACGSFASVEEAGLSVPIVQAFGCFTTDSYGNPLVLTSDQANATYAALLALATFTLPSEDSDTASKATVAQAMLGLSATVRRLALLQLANLTRSMTFASSGDAIGTRDELSEMMAVEILAAADDASTNSNAESGWVSDRLDRARAEMVADLSATAATLVPVATITLPQTGPSGAVAYALYGDGDGSTAARANLLALEADFIARNAIQDPGLVPGGVPLEYLVDTSSVTN